MAAQSGGARLDDKAIKRIVRQALSGNSSGDDDRRVVETGPSNIVVIAGEVAVRVARDRRAASELRRVQHLVDALPELPFAVPRSLGAVVEHASFAAVATRRISGDPHPPGSGDVGVLRDLLDAIRAVDVEPLRAWLAPREAIRALVADPTAGRSDGRQRHGRSRRQPCHRFTHSVIVMPSREPRVMPAEERHRRGHNFRDDRQRCSRRSTGRGREQGFVHWAQGGAAVALMAWFRTHPMRPEASRVMATMRYRRDGMVGVSPNDR